MLAPHSILALPTTQAPDTPPKPQKQTFCLPLAFFGTRIKTFFPLNYFIPTSQINEGLSLLMPTLKNLPENKEPGAWCGSLVAKG